jgi:hypothetical protein
VKKLETVKERARQVVITHLGRIGKGPLTRASLQSYELTYDFVYNILHKVVCNLFFNRFKMIRVDKRLKLES